MPTSSVSQDAFLMAVWSIRMETCDNVAVAVLGTYDLMLRFQEEAAFLTQAKWNVTKFLYIAARYIPFLTAPLWLVVDQVPYMGNADCRTLRHIAAACSMTTAFCAESIFMLRTCAMWQVKSYLRRIMFGVMIDTTATLFIMYCFFRGEYTFVPDVPPCNAWQVKKEPGLVWVLPIVFLMFELVLVILTVIKITKSHRSTQRPLHTLLLTHHTFHYSCGFLFTILRVLCIALLKFEYSISFLNTQITTRALFATRMQYQLWEVDRVQRSYHAEQHHMSLLFLHPTDSEETVTS
ncbi:hypothetical protein AZE42_10852 [Rhizopogon vesiculosus]|uniref:DUF6533 domain-containing protein n=1 Tax=Rhizopogon vesiculosus TaxID=180088 RepID=A0A1J8Q8G9_9AGAM|nr:hypothetical protein AZE42_10852 [Rhizopogon vesiculosus]